MPIVVALTALITAVGTAVVAVIRAAKAKPEGDCKDGASPPPPTQKPR